MKAPASVLPVAAAAAAGATRGLPAHSADGARWAVAAVRPCHLADLRLVLGGVVLPDQGVLVARVRAVHVGADRVEVVHVAALAHVVVARGVMEVLVVGHGHVLLLLH